ncbi:transposase [Dolosigranulum pigrum]|nr:transposase [Dolosigranulum pigrum]
MQNPFKLNIVQTYLDGPLDYHLLAKKYDVSSEQLIQNWGNQYQLYGEVGLKRKKTKKKYRLRFKLNVLKFKLKTDASYKETANAFGIGEPSIIANWKRLFMEGGVQRLNKPIGRPPKMPKSSRSSNQKTTQSKQKTDQIARENAQLREENTLLKIESAYLKKLRERGLSDPCKDNNQG